MQTHTIPELNYLLLDSLTEIQSLTNLQLIIDDRLKNGSKFFVFDIKNVEYLSSSGIRVFIKLQKHLKLFDGFLILLSPQKKVKDLLQIAELLEMLKVKDSFEEIINEFY